MLKVTIKDLLECGVHFGHQTRRWNPKMARYIFGDRNGIYIIDLEKTIICLEDACSFITHVVKSGKEVLFVGTKKQAQTIVEDAAKKAGMPYAVNRWLGGMLTNFETVRKSITHMNNITRMQENDAFKTLTKKEILQLLKERDKMKKNLEGIKDLTEVPGAIFIIDPQKESIAVREARKLNIPVIALIDTNCDPDNIDYPIPGNDDALRAIGVICSAVSDAVLEGLNEKEKFEAKEAKEKEAEAKKEAQKAKAKESAAAEKAPAEENESEKALKN